MTDENKEMEKRRLLDSIEAMRWSARHQAGRIKEEQEFAELKGRLESTFKHLNDLHATLAHQRAQVRDVSPGGKPPRRQSERRSQLETASPDASPQVQLLLEQLRVSHATCELLEDELQRLEKRALDAIAEAGKLRRRLDNWESGLKRSPRPAANEEEPALDTRESFLRFQERADVDRRLLTDALSASEAEIMRMTKAIDLLVRKLRVA